MGQKGRTSGAKMMGKSCICPVNSLSILGQWSGGNPVAALG